MPRWKLFVLSKRKRRSDRLTRCLWKAREEKTRRKLFLQKDNNFVHRSRFWQTYLSLPPATSYLLGDIIPQLRSLSLLPAVISKPKLYLREKPKKSFSAVLIRNELKSSRRKCECIQFGRLLILFKLFYWLLRAKN